jgi:hypothetical protein
MASILGPKVYIALDGDGDLVAEGSKGAVLDAARDWSEDHGGIAVLQTPDAGEDKVPNSTGDGGIQAYTNTGLKAVCMGLYGQPHLTADLVDDISIPEAWERIKNYLPKAMKWQGGAWNQSLLNGFLARNAKLSHSDSYDGIPGYTVGLSLSPHQVGLRGFGSPTSKGFKLPADLSLERNKDALFTGKMTGTGKGVAKWAKLPTKGKIRNPSTAIGVNKPFTVCFRSSPECRSACLVHSGQNPASNEALISKLALTAALYHDPAAFMRLLLANMRRFFKRATSKEKQGWALYIRLNVLSDIPWEHFFPDLMDPRMKLAMREPDYARKQWGNWRNRRVVGAGSFYDYTKIPFREERHAQDHADRYGISYAEAYKETSAFYPLTFSYSGTPKNAHEALDTLDAGGKVTVVFVLEHGEEFGGEYHSLGIAEVRLTTVHVKGLFGNLPKADISLLKQMWEYARSGEVGATLSRWLRKQREPVPGPAPREDRLRWSARHMAGVSGQRVRPSDLLLNQSEGGLRGAKTREWRETYKAQGDMRGWLYPFEFWGYPVINGDISDIRAKDQTLIPGGAIVGLDFKVPKIKISDKVGGKAKFKNVRVDLSKNAFVTAVREVDGQLIAPQVPLQTMDGHIPGDPV